MPEQSTPKQPASPYSHSCTSCGASSEYAPGTNALRCPYCGHEEQLAAPTRRVREHSYAELAAKPSTPAEDLAAQRFVCRGCGAHLQGDAVSQRCQFCTAALVVDTDSDVQIPPEAVLPFTLDRAGARTALVGWTKSRLFAPNRLKKVTEAEWMNSTYLPHWTFDTDTVSHYTGQRGQHYWVTERYTVTVNGQSETRTRRVRKTRWYPASGTVTRHFDDVLVTATRQVAPERLARLEPWPLDEAAPFQPGYVAGHESLRYDVEPEAGLAEAKDKMAPTIAGDCRRDIGGDEQRVHSVDTAYSHVTYKLMLLPVWIGSYLYGGKPFQILVNGRTGKVQGERPYSAIKIILAVLALIALVAAAIAWYRLSQAN